MCGIAGIFAYGDAAPPVDEAELLRIREHMVKRGPDGAGQWISPDRRVGLAHRRLAIIDLSESGAQPMATADGRLRITFNGEIYNYRALRGELERKGYVFRSKSDTEVLLHLYADRGAEMIHALRGMYAFGIWDEHRRGLFLARDPLGIKPLYFANDRGSFRFASQVKALLAGNGFRSTPDPAGQVGFHLWGHVPEPYTMYREIRALPAGCTLWTDLRGSRRPARFFDIAAVLCEAEENPAALSEHDLRERVRESMLDSVRHHLVADVPVGVFLSSGIDSAVLTALTAELNGKAVTVTLGAAEFKGTQNDEVPLAEMVARRYGAEHRAVWIGERDFANELKTVFAAMDQPTIDGINTYFISKAAASVGLKVAMSGIGGDELFGGYGSFRDVPRLASLAGPAARIPGFGKAFRIVSAPFFRQFTSAKYAGILEYGGSLSGAYLLRRGLFMPWELPHLLGREIAREGLGELKPLLRIDESVEGMRSGHTAMTALEMSWYMRNQLLRDADWAGMAHSLEIRVPFVDAQLFATLAPYIASGAPPRKQHLAMAPAQPLPRQIVDRSKTGFSVPVAQWLAKHEGRSSDLRGLRGWGRRVSREWPYPTPAGVSERRKTVLVFRIGQLGDTLISLPAIRAIRERHPEDRLLLLTNRRRGKTYVSAWDVLAPTGWFEEVVSYRPGIFASLSRGAGSQSLVNRLRELQVDVAYCLTPPRNALHHYRDRIFFKNIVGIGELHDTGIEARHPTAVGGHLSRETPEWHRLRNVVPGADANKNNFNLAPLIPIQEVDRADRLLRECCASPPSRIVAFGPGSKMPAKIWPAENFRDVAKRLLALDEGLHIVILGGSEDKDVGNWLVSEFGGRVHNFAGELTVLASAAMLLNCKGYVGNDTGTMHLAAMVGRPCVALFSARDNPGRWEPYGAGHVVLRHDVKCAGCMLQVCDRYQNKCMKLISVDEVYAATRSLLQNGDASHSQIN